MPSVGIWRIPGTVEPVEVGFIVGDPSFRFSESLAPGTVVGGNGFFAAVVDVESVRPGLC
jgi:LDH2 family malate/lactate/ureidoglycolate dehydrogenase